MAIRQRCVVQDRRQLCFKGRTKQIEGWRLGRRRDDLDARVVQFHAAGSGRRDDDIAFDHQHRFVVGCCQPCDECGVLDHDLRSAACVAQNKEAYAAELAQPLQPAA